jgi:sulfate permease, SulP family
MINKVFPFLSWFKGYDRSSFQIDLISGITVALVLIPQSMAYAQLAGLPPYYGLYASFLPPMIAALFGSSRQLATGPVAVVSLMTSASLEPLATAGSPGYIAYAVLLALTVGIFQFTLGVLRLGMVINLLSHPVVNGFTNAAAIIIATSQLSKLFGVYVDKSVHHYETIIRVISSAIHYTHWPTLGIGALAFGIMYGLKKINPKIPYVLVAVIVTSFISWAFKFEHQHQAPLSSIKSEKVEKTLAEFNEMVVQIKELSDKRAGINSDMIDEKQKHGEHTVDFVDLKHDLEVTTIRIEHLKHKSHLCRVDLRKIFFSGVLQGENGIDFYVKGEEPKEAETDGRVWRIKVGNKKIETDSLTMTGGGAVVGVIPKGLPKIEAPDFSIKAFLTLLPYAVIISLIGFMEAISIAKAMAAKTGQVLDPNQELIGQGIGNIIGSIGQSYPTSGSFSRSAVNLQSGAISGLSSVITSVAVVITLLFFTPFLYHLPQATLAAVIMMAVIGLVSITSFVHSWQTHRIDGAIQIITFIFVLAFAPHLDKGIGIGIVLSIGIYIFKGMKPGVAHLSLHSDGSYRDSEHWGLKECKHIGLIRFDGPLFFANASYFDDLVTERMNHMPELRHMVLVANGINDMDASGEDALALTVDNVRSAGIEFSISGIKEDVIALMKRTHLYEKIGEENIFATQAKAIEKIFDEAHKGSDEKKCPLCEVCEIDEG